MKDAPDPGSIFPSLRTSSTITDERNVLDDDELILQEVVSSFVPS